LCKTPELLIVYNTNTPLRGPEAGLINGTQ
jgi:hypothetical protein